MPRHVALQQAIISLNQVEKSPNKNNLIFAIDLGQSALLLLPFKDLVNCPVLHSNLGQDASHALLIVLNCLVDFLHVKI